MKRWGGCWWGGVGAVSSDVGSKTGVRGVAFFWEVFGKTQFYHLIMQWQIQGVMGLNPPPLSF